MAHSADNMPSTILSAASSLLRPILLILAPIVLLKGHNAPGGGFIAGLLAAGAFILYGFAIGAKAWNSFWVRPHSFIVLGLSFALGSGFLSLWQQKPFMTGIWGKFLGIKLGSPLLFDLGVSLTVLGVTLLILSSLMSTE